MLKDEIEEITLVGESENTKPLEEITSVFIHPNHPVRHVMIEIELTDELRVALVELLKENYDVFAC